VAISRRDFLCHGAGATAWGLLGGGLLGGGTAKGQAMNDKDSQTFFKVFPIGRIIKKKGQPVRLRIYQKYVPALKGLDGFSHVAVLYWFHKNDTPRKRGILQVYPRGDRKNPLTGVFACRAPVRPNLIALSVCKILSIEGGEVRIGSIDAFDDTPILDLKPHIPSMDAPGTGVRLPKWLTRKS